MFEEARGESGVYGCRSSIVSLTLFLSAIRPDKRTAKTMPHLVPGSALEVDKRVEWGDHCDF